jgi:hypothetical protein
MRHPVRVDDLADLISRTLRENDPLDPWITESSWDEGYWNGEAERIANKVTPGMSSQEVRALVVAELSTLLGSSADGEAGLTEQARRLDVVAAALAEALG